MVLSNSEEPAVRVHDVQQVRSPTARIARTIDEHALGLHKQIEVPSTEDDLERQVVLIVWSEPKEHVRATAIDWREDAIALLNAPPFVKAKPECLPEGEASIPIASLDVQVMDAACHSRRLWDEIPADEGDGEMLRSFRRRRTEHPTLTRPWS